MKKEKAKPLRWRLLAPLAATFALLWLGVVAILFHGEEDAVDSRVALARQQARESVESYWQVYKDNRANGLEDAGSRLRRSLSSQAMGHLDYMDGGLAILARDEETGEIFRSQITWGYGFETEEEPEQTWYLLFDQGLDREAHLAFGQWLLDHRRSWSYALRPRWRARPPMTAPGPG